MSLVFVPKIVYTNVTAVTVPFTIPMRLWEPVMTGAVAGMATSAAGIPETWRTRRDEKVVVKLRFKESEWAALATFLRWAHDTSGSFQFFFDATNTVTGSPVTVYLDKPTITDDVRPARGETKGTFELELTLRSTSATPINVRAY